MNAVSSYAVIVNDDPLQLDTLADLIRRTGLEPNTYNRAESALAVMDPAAPPLLIVTDIYMPDLDGWRFCRLLRSPEYPAFNHVPILIVSSTFSGDGPGRIAEDLGAEGFMSFPVQPDCFISRVRSLLEGKKNRDRPRALIVEDDPDTAKLLKQTMSNAGYRTVNASTITDAVQCFEEKSCHVAIIDYYLPDGTGDSLLERFCQPGSRCVCIMVTGASDPRLAVQWMRRGASAYLSKPFDPGYLVELCERARREQSLLRIPRLLEQRTRELRQSEARIRNVLENLPSGVVAADLETRAVVFANTAACTMLGYAFAELSAMNVDDLHLADDAPRLHGQFSNARLGLPFPTAVTPFLRRDGTVFTAEVHYARLDIDGRQCLLGVFVDITERKHADMERERLSTAIEQVGEAILITDADANILYVNPAFSAITGYQRDDVIGRNPRLLKSGEQDAVFYQNLWKTVSGGKTWEGRFVNKRKDGTFYTEDATISPVRNRQGETVHYVAVKRDITETLQMASLLVQAQKMESVGRLAGGVAHDFNNRLSVILGNVDLALESVGPDHPLYHDLCAIQQAARSSAEITRRLLAFARKQVTVPKVLDLNQTVASMLSMLRRLIGEHIDLKWCPGEAIGLVRADPAQIDQILANLCVNAADALGRNHGTIMVETCRIRHGETQPMFVPDTVPAGDYVRLSVSDDGCGMNAEQLSHLFEPFYTTKPVGQGTGLGLSTVYGIVKQNHGFINVYSEPDHGSRFSVYFPHYESDDPIQPESETMVRSSPPITVLLVEDDASVLRLTTRFLRRMHHTVLTAGSPFDALQIVKTYEGTLDLLMTDVVMPGMNGYALASQIAALRPGILRLFVSGYTADVLALDQVAEDGLFFIQKPFSAAELSAKIEEVLQSRPA